MGTYTRSGGKGIYSLSLDEATGDLQITGVTEGIRNPAFLDITPDGKYLYSVSEITDFQGQSAGGIVAYKIDPSTLKLDRLNEQNTIGPGPCHVSVDQNQHCVLVANYTGGSVVSFPLAEDGRLQPPGSFFQHEGSSVNPDRQEGPHGHSIYPTSDNRFALAPDLGLDQVMIYKLNAPEGLLSPHSPAFATIEPGHGPRHLDFHPHGKWVYVINEMGNSITAFHLAEDGSLEKFQQVPTLPDDFTGESTCADIHVHPTGKFLYGSNRGHDSLVIYAIDPENGTLNYVGHETRDCSTPRNFSISPDGKFILVGNQDKDVIATFRVDEATGLLEHTEHLTPVPAPVCLKFLPAPS